MSRADYRPDLAGYGEARQSARASVYLRYERKVPRGRRIYVQNMPEVAHRSACCAYAFHADARFMLQTGRTVRVLRASRRLMERTL